MVYINILSVVVDANAVLRYNADRVGCFLPLPVTHNYYAPDIIQTMILL